MDPEEREIYSKKLFLTKIFEEESKDQNTDKLDLIKKVFFVIPPSSLWLVPQDLIYFMNNSPLEEINNKLYHIFKSIPEFIDKIRIRKDFDKNHNFLFKLMLLFGHRRHHQMAVCLIVEYIG